MPINLGNNNNNEKKQIEKEKDTIPMSLVGSEDACSDDTLIRLRAGTPQFNEEQQMCELRNILGEPEKSSYF